MMNGQMFELTQAIKNSLGVLSGDIGFFLDLNQEASEMINGHDATLRVLIKQRLNLLRRLRYGYMEPATATEAHTVGLFGHKDGWIRAPQRRCVRVSDKTKIHKRQYDKRTNVVG